MIQDDKIGIGYGMLGLFQDPTFISYDGLKWTFRDDALVAHLKPIADAGANFVRFLLWGVWGQHKYGKRSQFQPFFLNVPRDAWDLDYWNDYFFPVLTKATDIINDLNMTAAPVVFDNCQFHKPEVKWSCWANNVQGIQSFYEKAADKYSKKIMFSTWNRLKKYDVLFPIGNENENSGFPDMFKRVVIPFIKKYGLPFDRLTYGATTKIVSGDSNQDIIRNAVEDTFGKTAERSIFMEDHGWPFTASLPIWGKKPWRKLYSDDGYYDVNGNRPSPAAWRAKSLYILNNCKLASFEHLPPKGDHSKPDREAAVIRAISESYYKRFGVRPKNWKQ